MAVFLSIRVMTIRGAQLIPTLGPTLTLIRMRVDELTMSVIDRETRMLRDMMILTIVTLDAWLLNVLQEIALTHHRDAVPVLWTAPRNRQIR